MNSRGMARNAREAQLLCSLASLRCAWGAARQHITHVAWQCPGCMVLCRRVLHRCS